MQLMECVGYACRIYSHYRPFLVVLFIIQYFMIVVVSSDLAHNDTCGTHGWTGETTH